MDDDGRSTRDRLWLEWTTRGAVKKVTIVTGAGARFSGRDWTSWDVAYRNAIHEARSRLRR